VSTSSDCGEDTGRKFFIKQLQFHTVSETHCRRTAVGDVDLHGRFSMFVYWWPQRTRTCHWRVSSGRLLTPWSGAG